MVLPREVREDIQNGIVRCIEDSVICVAVAPTGSGKSRFAMHRREVVKRFTRVIHVLPMRSLVEDLVVDLACALGRDIVGYQAGVECIAYERRGDSCEAIDPIKILRREIGNVEWVDHDPYMVHRYVVTTYDSYSLSLALAPIPEIVYASYGHPDASLAIAAQSLNIYDEIHLLAPDVSPTTNASSDDQVKAWSFVAAITKLLTKYLGTRVLYSTATMTPDALYVLSKAVGIDALRMVLASSRWIRDEFSKRFPQRIDFVDVESRASDYVENYLNALKTEIVGTEPSDVVTRLCRDERFDRILVVLNTVERAVNTYERCREVCEARGYEVLLVHGRMSRLHRSRVSARIRELMRGRHRFVVVATQVVEAGIDLDADALVSDVAPTASLIQRCGRVLRHGIREGLVVISASENAVRACRRIYGVECSDLAEELRDLVAKCGSKVDWRYGAPEKCTVYKLLLKPVPENALEQLLDDVEDGSNEILNFILFAPLARERLRERIEEFDELYGGSLVRNALRAPLIVKYMGFDDIVETPLWYAKRLAREGYLKKLRFTVTLGEGSVSSKEEIVELSLTLRKAEEILEHLERQPLTKLRIIVTRLKKYLRESRGYSEPLRVSFDGFVLAEDVYDEVKGLV